MTGRVYRADIDFFMPPSEREAPLIDALRSERRHAAVLYLSTGIALGIGFALFLDLTMAFATRM